MVDLRMVGDEAVFLDQLTCEFGESIPFAVAMKSWSEDMPEDTKGVSGSTARPVLHAEVHHAAHE